MGKKNETSPFPVPVKSCSISRAAEIFNLKDEDILNMILNNQIFAYVDISKSEKINRLLSDILITIYTPFFGQKEQVESIFKNKRGTFEYHGNLLYVDFIDYKITPSKALSIPNHIMIDKHGKEASLAYEAVGNVGGLIKIDSAYLTGGRWSFSCEFYDPQEAPFIFSYGAPKSDAKKLIEYCCVHENLIIMRDDLLRIHEAIHLGDELSYVKHSGFVDSFSDIELIERIWGDGKSAPIKRQYRETSKPKKPSAKQKNLITALSQHVDTARIEEIKIDSDSPEKIIVNLILEIPELGESTIENPYTTLKMLADFFDKEETPYGEFTKESIANWVKKATTKN